MKNNSVTREKAARGQVLNLSELALVSGYGRSSLTAMKLPLICGKISLSDFQRIIRQRQDKLECSRAPGLLAGARSTIVGFNEDGIPFNPSDEQQEPPPRRSHTSVEIRSVQSLADDLRAPRRAQSG